MDSYNKIIRVSNALYNDGLERAKVRDLSGAIQSQIGRASCRERV